MTLDEFSVFIGYFTNFVIAITALVGFVWYYHKGRQSRELKEEVTRRVMNLELMRLGAGKTETLSAKPEPPKREFYKWMIED